MKVYWSLAGVPELAALAPDERADAFRRAVKSYRSRLPVTRRVLEFAGLCLAGGVASVVAFLLIPSPVLGAAVGGMFGAAVGNHVRLAQAASELKSNNRLTWHAADRSAGKH